MDERRPLCRITANMFLHSNDNLFAKQRLFYKKRKKNLKNKSYSAQQDSIRDANTGDVFCGIVSLLFWKATAPTTYEFENKS